MHSIPIICRASAIPDAIRVDVGNLHLNQALHVSDLTASLPEGVKIDADADLLLVHVTTRATTPEPAEGGEGPVQPEVIKPERKEKEE